MKKNLVCVVLIVFTLILIGCDSDFSSGDSLAYITIEDKGGFINKKGDMIIELQYDSGLPFSEGLASVKVDDKWGYIDTSDSIVIAPQFYGADAFKLDFNLPILKL
jgi:hypothetical protein